MATVKRAAWLSWVTLPVILFAAGGLISLALGLIGATVAGFAWAMGAKGAAALIMIIAGAPLGLLVAIATVFWTDQRKQRLREAGL